MLAWSHFYKTTSANEPFLWMLSSFHEWINVLIFHSSVDILSSIIETHFNHWKLSNNYFSTHCLFGTLHLSITPKIPKSYRLLSRQSTTIFRNLAAELGRTPLPEFGGDGISFVWLVADGGNGSNFPWGILPTSMVLYDRFATRPWRSRSWRAKGGLGTNWTSDPESRVGFSS